MHLSWLGHLLTVRHLLNALRSACVVLSSALFLTPALVRPGSAAEGLEVFATGLDHPRGLAFGPDGNLYVAEAGRGGERQVEIGEKQPLAAGHNGRISRIAPDGTRSTLVDGLPSIVTAFNEEVGPSGLAFVDADLYVLTASGGWDIGDPAYHNAIYHVGQDGSLARIFDYSQYFIDHVSSARLLDPRANVPFGMPHGLASLNGRLYTTDGNQERVLEVTTDGQARLIYEYPASNRALTGITGGPDGALYVTHFAAGKVTRIELDGTVTEVTSKLRAPIGLGFDGHQHLLVLEYFLDRNVWGRLLRPAPIDAGPHAVLATNLAKPTGLAFGPDGPLYIAIGGSETGSSPPQEGEIVRLRV